MGKITIVSVTSLRVSRRKLQINESSIIFLAEDVFIKSVTFYVLA